MSISPVENFTSSALLRSRREERQDEQLDQCKIDVNPKETKTETGLCLIDVKDCRFLSNEV